MHAPLTPESVEQGLYSRLKQIWKILSRCCLSTSHWRYLFLRMWILPWMELKKSILWCTGQLALFLLEKSKLQGKASSSTHHHPAPISEWVLPQHCTHQLSDMNKHVHSTEPRAQPLSLKSTHSSICSPQPLKRWSQHGGRRHFTKAVLIQVYLKLEFNVCN